MRGELHLSHSDFLKEDHSGWQAGRARGLGDLSGLQARKG